MVEDFAFASASQVARHVWPERDSVDSHKNIARWREYPEYRNDVKLRWYGQNPEKFSANVKEALQRGDTDSEASNPCSLRRPTTYEEWLKLTALDTAP